MSSLLKSKIEISEVERKLLKSLVILSPKDLENPDTTIESNFIDTRQLWSKLKKTSLITRFELLFSKESTSTQNVLYKYLDTYPRPLIYVTETQTQGRGIIKQKKF